MPRTGRWAYDEMARHVRSIGEGCVPPITGLSPQIDQHDRVGGDCRALTIVKAVVGIGRMGVDRDVGAGACGQSFAHEGRGDDRAERALGDVLPRRRSSSALTALADEGLTVSHPA
jgi:hypothetical protein